MQLAWQHPGAYGDVTLVQQVVQPSASSSPLQAHLVIPDALQHLNKQGYKACCMRCSPVGFIYGQCKKHCQEDDAKILASCCGPQAALLQRFQHINKILETACVPARGRFREVDIRLSLCVSNPSYQSKTAGMAAMSAAALFDINRLT